MKKQIKLTMLVALVAAAGLGAYETYQDYKADKESNLVMQNIEVLTEDDISGEWYLHHFECVIRVPSKTWADVILQLFGKKTKQGKEIDLSDATQYFNDHPENGEGPCEKGEQKTCGDVTSQIYKAITENL